MQDKTLKLEQLSPQQKALLLKKLAAKQANAATSPTIAPRPADVPAPMAYAQQRLWFLQTFTGADSLYTMPIFLRLRGVLDLAALEAALSLIIGRHDVLRTRFYQTDAGSFQQILPAKPFSLPVDDLTGVPDQDSALQTVLQDLADTRFDLGQGQPLRLRLIRLAADDHVLATCVHHIVTDGWSVNVFMREFAALYQSRLNGTSSPLAPLTLQFADYAYWQQQALQTGQWAEHLAFWRDYLADAPTLLELPTDFPRPKTSRQLGAVHTFQIAQPLAGSLSALARRLRVSPFVLMLSVFGLLLGRYSGQTDVLIGTPFAGRLCRELEDLIGFFVNSLPVKINCAGQLSFSDMLQQTKRSFLDISDHQAVPFEKIVEFLQPERNESVSPLFQVMFTYNHASAQSLPLDGLAVELIPAPRSTAKFDMTLSVQEAPDGLDCALEYDTDLFSATGMARMMGYYVNLLQAVAAKPDGLLSGICLLAEDEYRAIVYGRNNSVSNYPRLSTVHENFQKQAQATPDQPALIHGDRVVCYRELNSWANRLAWLLSDYGVVAGDRVALYLERGIDMVAVLLAVLKSGASYLPLDLAYPTERLTLMIEDADSVLMITQSTLADTARAINGAGPLLVLDLADLSAYPDTDPEVLGWPNALAYIMYTSGSTGVPKGVTVAHAAINRLVLSTDYVDIRPGDRIAQASNTAFDAATFEVWGALLNGASLVIVDRDISLAADAFAGFLAQQKINVLFLTTALFNQIVQQQADAFAGLRYLLFGGEAVDPVQVRKVLEQGKPEHFLHVYGPTENTTFTSWYDIQQVAPEAVTVPIGWALANTRLYILDRCLQPVPVGVCGELYIAGDGLSQGYWHQSRESADKFVPDPFAAQSGERMYRSGDRVRCGEDGAMEFIGRADQQVKIRGFRIELSGIAAAIATDPAIQQVRVLARDYGDSGKRLLAYFTVSAQHAFDADGLRSRLQTLLPAYMQPSALVRLEAMPLTPNGKINDKALPEPEAGDYQTVRSEAPVTDDETRLAAIWQQLLAVEPTRDSDFFLSGGHSLLAMQLISRIQNVFGVKLPVREVFTHSTLRGQAQAIAACQQHADIAVTPAPQADSYPLSFAQERLYFLQQLYPQSTAYNMAVALKLSGALDVARLQHCLNAIVQRHAMLRTVFVQEGGQVRQKILGLNELRIQHDDLCTDDVGVQAQQLQNILAEESAYVFALDCLPLIRVRLLRMAQDRHVLVINNHHLLSDGWSQGLFIRELAVLYGAQPDTAPAELLPPLPVQYADYAVWQRQWLDGARLETLLAYWRRKLADYPPALDLHADFARPALPTFAAASVPFSLDASLTRSLLRLAEQSQCSFFTLLLAALTVFLARYSGQQDIAVGTPVANRTQQETEPLIGFFVNTLVLRHCITGNPQFTGLLSELRETVIDAFAHQGLPFEKLVEALQPERDLAGTPFFQVLFVYQNVGTEPLGLADLQVEPLPLVAKEAKFDLTLAIQEGGEQMTGVFEYNTDVFKAETIQRLCNGFFRVLEQIARQPTGRIGDFSLLDDGLYQRVVHHWNANAVPVNAELYLHTLFEQRAVGCPEAIAVEQAGVRLMYGELNAKADRLAAILTAQGAGPETMIGVCLQRTPDLIVALLAILKSGAAYVPLDPDYPSARLAHALQDADVLLLLTESHTMQLHASLAATSMLLLDQAWPDADLNLEVGRQRLSQQNLAYLLYTSGSTGKPKGVAITHRSAVAMVAWAQTVYSGAQLSRVLAGTSVCFDLSVFEIFATLAAGGTVVLLRNVVEIAEFAYLAPGLINTVPSAAEELLRADALPVSVRIVNLAGEPLSTDLVNKLYAKPHIEKVYDLYGPSEDTTYSTYTLRAAHASPCIGQPIDNTQAYVLDAYGQPGLPGTPGELFLGGMGLARGYHKQPRLTAEKFVPDPFSGVVGGRLYRTGDLVSFTAPDGDALGELVYHGRLDHQVKVRGYRIELGEIQTLLLSDAGVEDCVVLTLGDAAASDRKLVAYVKSSTDDVASLEARLYELCKACLPGFMVPAALVMLTEFPLTPNGKLDRKALPDPKASLPVAPVLSPPVGYVQQTLAKLWREILQLDRELSADDDFFELGGHSLLVLDLMTQIKVTFGKSLPLAAIFQASTIQSLARLIADDIQTEWTPLVALQAQGERTPLFCIHPVGGHVICYNDLAKALGHGQPVYGLRAAGMDAQQDIVQTLPVMAAHYVQAIRTVQARGPYCLLGYSFGGLVAYEMACQLEAVGESIAFLGLLDTAHPELTQAGVAQTDHADFLVSLFSSLGFDAEALREYDEAAQLKRVFARAKQAGLVPRAMDDEACKRYFDVCRSNLQMLYDPAPINSQITLFRAKDGARRITDDDYLGWSQDSGLGISLHWLPGCHENMMETPQISHVARLINETLERIHDE
ncbi:MAG: amino acid adenylation domain-containing protein [Methylovulum sp.]|nr:amino acid adenylation domain-containing protein [Methylovulum sp.]